MRGPGETLPSWGTEGPACLLTLLIRCSTWCALERRCHALVLCACQDFWCVYSSFIRTLTLEGNSLGQYVTAQPWKPYCLDWAGGSSLYAPFSYPPTMFVGRINELLSVKLLEQDLTEGSCQHLSAVSLKCADPVDVTCHLWGVPE